MRYVDGDTGKEISEEDLVEVVAEEVKMGLIKATHRLEHEPTVNGGLSYYGGKTIRLNLGHPVEEDITAAKHGTLYATTVFSDDIPLDNTISECIHEELIELAKTRTVSWVALKRAIFSHARFGWPMAVPYWTLLEDLLLDRVTDAPKDIHYKKADKDYLAYLIAAKNISERFGIVLTRNDDPKNTTTRSALDLVANSVGLSYATLKRDAYTPYHKELHWYW